MLHHHPALPCFRRLSRLFPGVFFFFLLQTMPYRKFLILSFDGPTRSVCVQDTIGVPLGLFCLIQTKSSCACFHLKVKDVGGQRAGSAVRSPCCSCRRPRFHSQHPHAGPQPFATLVPGDLTPPSDFHGFQTHMREQEHTHTHTYTGRNTHPWKVNKPFKRKPNKTEGTSFENLLWA